MDKIACIILSRIYLRVIVGYLKVMMILKRNKNGHMISEVDLIMKLRVIINLASISYEKCEWVLLNW